MALPSPPGGLLRTPADHVEQATHMPRVRGDTKVQTDDGGDPTAGPEFSWKPSAGGPRCNNSGKRASCAGSGSCMAVYYRVAYTLDSNVRVSKSFNRQIHIGEKAVQHRLPLRPQASSRVASARHNNSSTI